MKMYIIIKDNMPVSHAVLASAHASLAAYVKFKDTEEVKQWPKPFRFYKLNKISRCVN